MISITFINSTNVDMSKWEEFATQILTVANNHMKLKYPLSLSVQFVDSITAQQINIKERNESYIPDVLSFPIEMNEKEIEMMGVNEIGDLIICFEEANNKSIRLEHSINEEMAFLFIHGYLHLLGYDHEISLEDEEEMFALQEKLLDINGFKYVIKFTKVDYE